MATFNTKEIGEIIVLAGVIEDGLRQCGGQGRGLRELSDSLGAKITPEVRSLLVYIGMIRNYAAHEGVNAEVADWNPAVFAEACEMVIMELDKLSCIPKPKRTKQTPKVVEYEDAAEEFLPEPTRLPWVYLSIIPGLHLLYPLALLRDAFSEVGWAIFGIINYVLAGFSLYFAITLPFVWGFLTAGIFLLSGTFAGAIYRGLHIHYIPILNVLLMGRELVGKTGYVKLLGALTLWAIPLISFELIFHYNEVIAGVALAAVGYVAGVVIGFILRQH